MEEKERTYHKVLFDQQETREVTELKSEIDAQISQIQSELAEDGKVHDALSRGDMSGLSKSTVEKVTTLGRLIHRSYQIWGCLEVNRHGRAHLGVGGEFWRCQDCGGMVPDRIAPYEPPNKGRPTYLY